MGFYKNMGSSRDRVAKNVYSFIMNASATKQFGLFGIFEFECAGIASDPRRLDINAVKRPNWSFIKDTSCDNIYYTVNEDLTVRFHTAIYFCDITADKIPFKLDESNSISLVKCSDDMLDYLPEKCSNLWLYNTCRKDKSISFARLKEVTRLFIVSSGTRLTKFNCDNVTANTVKIINCPKLTSTTGMPVLVDSNSTCGVAGVAIRGKNESIALDVKSKATYPAEIFVDKKIENVPVISLPKNISIFNCQGALLKDVVATGADIKHVECKDYKGRGEDIVNLSSTSNSINDAKEKLKGILDELISKKWNMFNDLRAVATYFDMIDYWNDNVQLAYKKVTKSACVRDGRIYCVDPEGQCFTNRFGGVSYPSIKSGITNYLNKIGVKYTIGNDNPRKSKIDEYVKIVS